MLVEQSWFYTYILSFVADTSNTQTEIFANEYPVFYEESPEFVNVSNNNYQNRRPKLTFGAHGYWTIDVLMTYETYINGNWAIYGSKNTVEIIGGINENISGNKFNLNCYPNPMTSETTISYQIEENANINIGIYDYQGRSVCDLLNSWQEKGEHKVRWKGINKYGLRVPEGVYFCRIISDNILQSAVVLIKN
jgi:hypothetical protein